MISDLGLINLMGAIICNAANDLRYRSGLVLDFCPICDRDFEEADFKHETCIRCGRAIYTYNNEAEKFIDSEWFEDIISSGNTNLRKVKWLIKNRKVAIRKNYE